MQKNKSIVDYYNARASEYEQIYYREVPERRKEIDDHCDYVRKIAKGKSILDLACGTGYWTKVASETARKIIATDISLEMISEARRKEYRCPTEFVAASIYDLPFQPNSFDLVVLGFWLSHEPRQNIGSLFELLLRQLKPGGKIWMIDNNPPAEGSNTDSAGTDESGNNLKFRKLENGEKFVIVKNYFAEFELSNLLSPKFKVIDLIYQKYYWSAYLSLK